MWKNNAELWKNDLRNWLQLLSSISLSLNILWWMHSLTVSQLSTFNWFFSTQSSSILTVLRINLSLHIRILLLSCVSSLTHLCLQSLSAISFRLLRWRRTPDEIYIKTETVIYEQSIHRMTATIEVFNLTAIYTMTIRMISTITFIQIITSLVNFLVNFLVVKLLFLCWINLIKLLIKSLFSLVSLGRIKTLIYSSEILWYHSNNLSMTVCCCSQQLKMLCIVSCWISTVLISQAMINEMKKQTDLMKAMKQTTLCNQTILNKLRSIMKILWLLSTQTKWVISTMTILISTKMITMSIIATSRRTAEQTTSLKKTSTVTSLLMSQLMKSMTMLTQIMLLQQSITAVIVERSSNQTTLYIDMYRVFIAVLNKSLFLLQLYCHLLQTKLTIVNFIRNCL